MNKEQLFKDGVKLMFKWCELNQIQPPIIERLTRSDRRYFLATCAYYRPTAIHIMVEKCATPGMGGRAWSWPGYVIDRTPYGVIQHELGHHVDNHFYGGCREKVFSTLLKKEAGGFLTNYRGTDDRELTADMEWFSEHFRLFVTNPDLLRHLRPKTYNLFLGRGLRPVTANEWDSVLATHQATDRIMAMARKKVGANPLILNNFHF